MTVAIIDRFRIEALESLKGSYFDFETNVPASLAENMESRMGDIVRQDGVIALASYVSGIKEYYDKMTPGTDRFTWFIRGFRQIISQKNFPNEKSAAEITKDVKTWVDFGFSNESQTAFKIAIGEHLYTAANKIGVWKDNPWGELEEICLKSTKLSSRDYLRPLEIIQRFQEGFELWYKEGSQDVLDKIKQPEFDKEEKTRLLACFCSQVVASSERSPAGRVKDDFVFDLFKSRQKMIKEKNLVADDQTYKETCALLYEFTFFNSKTLKNCLEEIKKDKYFSPWVAKLKKEKFNLIGVEQAVAGHYLSSVNQRSYNYPSGIGKFGGWSRWCVYRGYMDEAKVWEAFGAPKITEKQLLKLIQDGHQCIRTGFHPTESAKLDKDLAYMEKTALEYRHSKPSLVKNVKLSSAL